MSIFVQIVSYKNFDVVPTVRNCIEKAKDKMGLYFGITLQQDEDVPSELSHERIKVVKVPFRESKGHGWARRQAQDLYSGQDYTIQVEAGSRFADNWDEELINTLNSLGERAIITNYANKFDINTGNPEVQEYAFKPAVYSYSDVPVTWANPMKGVQSVVKGRWISDHFFFAKGFHCNEVKHDPEIYYSDIESSLTLKSFCAGFDIYHHNKPLIWRDYTNRPMNWQDDSDWWAKDEEGKKKFRDLSEVRTSELPGTRSLRDFELYSGIDFKNKRLQKTTVNGTDPPCAYQNEDQWNKDYMKDYSIVVSWDVNEIEKSDDYDYWYFSVEDDTDFTIFRQDLRVDRDADVLNFKVNYKKIFFKATDGRVPTKICVWPVSKTKGWLKKSKFPL